MKKRGISFKVLNLKAYTAYCMLMMYLAIDPITQIINTIFDLDFRGISMVSLGLLALHVLCLFRRRGKFIYGLSYFKIAFLNILIIFVIYFLSYPVVMDYAGVYLWRQNSMRFTSMKYYYFSFLRNNMLPALLMFIAGSRIIEFKEIFRKREIRFITYLVYFIFSGLIYIAKLKAGNGLMGQSVFVRHGGVSYLLVGDTLAIFSVFLLCMIKRTGKKYLLLANTTYLLYIVASRTSFYFFCIILVIFLIREFAMGSIYKKIFILNFFSIVISIALYTYLQRGDFYSFISENNRMTAVVTDISVDSSYRGRLEQFQEGFCDIKEFWLTGRLFREVERTGNNGTYMHNILSYWVEFGIFLFLLLFGQCIIFLYKNLKNYLKYKGNYTVELVFITGMFMMISILISRSFVYPYVWFAIAASARLNDFLKYYK